MKQKIYIMKRSGERVEFDIDKIKNAIRGANTDDPSVTKIVPEEIINSIAESIKDQASQIDRDLTVEEIQNMVENQLMTTPYHEVARNYITYRYHHNELRQRQKKTDIDQKIANIVELNNEEVKQENSNKNPTILSVQRDYMAGEWSRYYSNKYLLPKDVVEAHKEGIIHFHDADYYAQHMHNCCLINLDDMLQNGTCISGTRIDKPHSFLTACTVTSQIVAQVASSQYGF